MSKKNFQLAEEQKAFLISEVKDNHPRLHTQITTKTGHVPPKSLFKEQVTKDHGRIEQRMLEVFEASSILQQPFMEEWPSIKQVYRVTRIRQVLSKKNKEPNKETTEVHYFITNGFFTAEKAAQYIRHHWAIENSLHYVKDQTFHEDTTIKKCNPNVFSGLIDIALNFIRIDQNESIRTTLIRNSFNFKKVLDSMSKFF